MLELFAILHDSRRQNENDDPEHGNLTAKYVQALRGQWFDLSNAEMAMLVKAFRHHSDGLLDSELTVQVFGDADRLDLGMVVIRPQAEYLGTPFVRGLDAIETAY